MTCDGVATFPCGQNKHLCIDITSGFMKNLQLVMSLTGEYAEIRIQGQIKLAEAIKKKKEELQYHSLVIKEARAQYLEQKREEEESQDSLADLTSRLKTTDQWGSTKGAPGSIHGKGQEQDADLSDLLSLLSGSTGQETTESFQRNMTNKFVHLFHAKIKSAAIEVAEFEERKKVNLIPLLEDSVWIIP